MKRYLAILTALACVARPPGMRAEDTFPRPEWTDAPNPLASPAATPGGTMAIWAGPYPSSLNYLLENNSFVAEVFASLFEPLLGMDPVTAEYEPGLAARWSISDDKRTFTFWLDPRARWSDGQPITADDVRWTYDTIMNPTNLTGVHKVALETFSPPEVVSSNCVRFTAKEVHWRNLGAAGTFPILPRHAYAGQDFNKLNFSFPVVSGPYRLGDLQEGLSLKLERRDDWWARCFLRSRNVGNFQTLLFRFYEEQENAFEAFKKGNLDLFPVYMARLWVNEAKGDKFDRNWIVKQRVENYQPIGFQGFAMNMRRPPFDDLKVRQAMGHLVDRERMNRTIMYSQYFLHRSYFEDLYNATHPCPNPLTAFDKESARKLLGDAGWKANPETGILEKDGKRFSFRFLTRDASSDKFLSIFQEDLKDVGIAMSIDKKDGASWSKDMDTFNYEMTWAAWGGGLHKDPEDMWSSKEAERTSGNNITGFRDPRVDALIEKQKSLFDVQARHAIVREIDGLVVAQSPYALLWNINAVRLLYWNKFGAPPTVLSKFGDERSAYTYWWHDPDTVAELDAAMAGNAFLPPKPERVVFDETFVPTSHGTP